MRKDRLSKILSPPHGSRECPNGPSSGLVSGGVPQVVLGYQLCSVQVPRIHRAEMLFSHPGMACA